MPIWLIRLSLAPPILSQTTHRHTTPRRVPLRILTSTQVRAGDPLVVVWRILHPEGLVPASAPTFTLALSALAISSAAGTTADAEEPEYCGGKGEGNGEPGGDVH